MDVQTKKREISFPKMGFFDPQKWEKSIFWPKTGFTSIFTRLKNEVPDIFLPIFFVTC